MKISGCRITFFNSWTIFWESPYARARRSVDQKNQIGVAYVLKIAKEKSVQCRHVASGAAMGSWSPPLFGEHVKIGMKIRGLRVKF